MKTATLHRYSNIKALRHPERIASIRAREVTPPTHVQLVLSDLCNQSCHFCSYRDPGYQSSQLFHVEGNYNPNRKIPFEKVVEMLDDFAEMGVKGIQLTGGGEPTVHPQFGQVLDEIRKRRIPYGLITNGVLLHKFDVSDAAWLRISIDAAKAETYSKIRSVPRDHFDRALSQVEKYKAGTGFVVTHENWDEVADAVRLYKSLGARNVRIAPQFTEQNALPFFSLALPFIREAVAEAIPGFDVFSRFEDKHEEVNSIPTDQLCGYQYFTTFIGADQNMYRCCVYAYNERGLIGSVKERRFKDAWAEAWPKLRSLDATSCVGCHYQDINRTLAYALADRTQDEEFV